MSVTICWRHGEVLTWNDEWYRLAFARRGAHPNYLVTNKGLLVNTILTTSPPTLLDSFNDKMCVLHACSNFCFLRVALFTCVHAASFHHYSVWHLLPAEALIECILPIFSRPPSLKSDISLILKRTYDASSCLLRSEIGTLLSFFLLTECICRKNSVHSRWRRHRKHRNNHNHLPG